VTTQNERLLKVLRRGPATCAEIHQRAGHLIVNSRVAELRARGYRIECEYVGGKGASAYRYSLLSEPTLPASRENEVALGNEALGAHSVGSLSSDRFDGFARGRTRLPLPSIVPAVPTPAAGTQLSIEVAA
jgi:hypothetical protein